MTLEQKQHGPDNWTIVNTDTGAGLGIHWYHYPGFEESYNVTGNDYEMTKHQKFDEAYEAARAWLTVRIK